MKKFFGILIGLSLLAATVIGLRSQSAAAADEDTENNYYILEINTGTATQMSQSDLAAITVVAVIDGEEKTLGVDYNWSPSYDSAIRSNYDTFGMGGSENQENRVNYISKLKWSNTTLYFQLKDGKTVFNGKIDSIKSIHFKISEKQESLQIHTLRVYEIPVSGGTTPVTHRLGYVSTEPYVELSGKIISKLCFAEDENLSNPITYTADTVYARAVLITQEDSVLTTEAANGYGYYYGLVSHQNETYTTNVSTYYLELDFADLLGAGIDKIKMGPNDFNMTSVRETMTLTIAYYDTKGAVHVFAMPVFTSALMYAYDNGIREVGYMGTQGSRVIVPLNLPDFAGFLVDPAVSLLDENVSCAQSSGQAFRMISDVMTLAGEKVQIAGNVFYKENTGKLGVSVDEANSGKTLSYDTSNLTPVYYWRDTTDPLVLNATKVTTTTETEVTRKLSFWEKIGHLVSECEWKDTVKEKKTETNVSYTANLVQLVFDKYQNQSTDNLFHQGQYMVEIRTADVEAAGSLEDLYVELTYVDKLGKEQTTGKINYNEAVKEYQGYVQWGFGTWLTASDLHVWKGYQSELETANGAAYQGQTRRFFIEADNVSYFESATFYITQSDNWIISEFNLYQVQSASAPIIVPIALNGNEYESYRIVNGKVLVTDLLTATNSTSTSNGKTCANWTDSLGTENRLAHIVAEENTGSGDDSIGIYVDKTTGKKVSFISKSIDSLTNDTVYEGYYQLDFDTACGGMGFSDNLYRYYVTVQVATDTYSIGENGTSNDDSGSTNFFYFKLVFENGESAYVQANQQLTGDAFRAGQPARFTITLNHNYGDLKKIKIIPENDVEKGSPYDKLKIEKITVEQSDYSGHVKNWVFEGDDGSGIGWIGIDYSDVQSQTHTESELAKVSGLSSSGTGINLLFAITTDAASETDGVTGSIWAEIGYKKASTGRSDSVTVDVIKAIREFNNDLDWKTDANGVLGNKGQFRRGHTDRFTLSMSDIYTLQNITFYGYSDTGEKITISSIAVYVINQGNIEVDRTMNYDGEYIIQDCKKTQVAAVTPANYSPGSNLVKTAMSGDTLQKTTFRFKDAATNIMGNNGSESIYSVEEIPTLGSETINLIVNSPSTQNLSNVKLQALIEYKTSEGTSIQTKATLTCTSSNDSGNKFASYSVAVPTFSTIKKINLYLDENCEYEIPVSAITVQYLKGDTLLATYKGIFDTSNNDVRNQILCTGFDSDASGTEYQKVYIELDSSCEASLLVAKDHDIAVALDICADKDSDTETYTSKNYFLTAEGSGVRILPGNVLEFTLTEANIEAIKDIRISATGNLAIVIDKIAVATYADGENTGWYSYDGEVKEIKNETKEIIFTSKEKSTKNTVNVLDFAFTTALKSDQYSSVGVESAIAMEIQYKDGNDIKTLFIPDVNKKLTSGSFLEGATANVRVLATGITSANIMAVRLVPYDAESMGEQLTFDGILQNNIASNLHWGLTDLSVDFGDGEDFTQPNSRKHMSVTVGKVITGRTGETINLASAVVEAVINYTDPATDTAIEPVTLTNSDTIITVPYVEDGVDFTVDVSIYDGESGWAVITADDTAYGKMTVEGATQETTVSNTYTIHLTGNVENKTQKTLIFRSLDNTERQVKIVFVMNDFTESNGEKPLKVTASTTAGVTKTAYTGQTMNLELGTNVSTLNFTYSSEQNITPVIALKKLSGNDVTYTATNPHDGTYTITFGNRGTEDSAYVVTWTYQLDDNETTNVVTATIVVKGSASGYAKGKTFTFSTKNGTTDISGVIVSGREDTITLPNKDNLVITYKLSDNATELKDVTEYNDTATETEDSTATDTETNTEADTETDTETVTETNTETEEAASASSSAAVTPDPDRATISKTTILLPNGSKTYTFNYDGNFVIERK